MSCRAARAQHGGRHRCVRERLAALQQLVLSWPARICSYSQAQWPSAGLRQPAWVPGAQPSAMHDVHLSADRLCTQDTINPRCTSAPPNCTHLDALAGGGGSGGGGLQLRHIPLAEAVHPLMLPAPHVIGIPGAGMVDGLAQHLAQPAQGGAGGWRREAAPSQRGCRVGWAGCGVHCAVPHKRCCGASPLLRARSHVQGVVRVCWRACRAWGVLEELPEIDGMR